MNFNIECKSCMNNIKIHDGYNNESEIEIKIIGESVIEITCKSCKNSITTFDGNII